MVAYRGPDGQEDLPYLLTPGPVTTSRGVKIAMLADYGAFDEGLVNNVRHIRSELLRIAGCSETHDCVLLSGTDHMAAEAAIASLCPARRKKTLVICNGADGERAVQTLQRLGRPFVRLAYRETTVPRASDVAKTLDEDRNISHVWLVHCETSTGMLNPVRDIAAVVKGRGRVMMLDATVTFGGLALHMVDDNLDVLVATSDSSLESVPGISFVIAERNLLAAGAGEAPTASLDLQAQCQTQVTSGTFVAVPATHALVALREALREFDMEGGVAGRSKRYVATADTVRERLKAMGFSLLLADVEASPIVQVVLAPRAATFEFKRLYEGLYDRGFAIASGQLSQRASFRVGCIGKVDAGLMQHFITATEEVLNSMDVKSFAPVEP